MGPALVWIKSESNWRPGTVGVMAGDQEKCKVICVTSSDIKKRKTRWIWNRWMNYHVFSWQNEEPDVVLGRWQAAASATSAAKIAPRKGQRGWTRWVWRDLLKRSIPSIKVYLGNYVVSIQHVVMISSKLPGCSHHFSVEGFLSLFISKNIWESWEPDQLAY